MNAKMKSDISLQLLTTYIKQTKQPAHVFCVMAYVGSTVHCMKRVPKSLENENVYLHCGECNLFLYTTQTIKKHPLGCVQTTRLHGPVCSTVLCHSREKFESLTLLCNQGIPFFD
jgi:hypothetical protein